jgi:hypothetical protein
VFGYCLYIAERVVQPDLFNFADSLYLSVEIVITGWAGDAFSQMDPISRLGRALCLLTVVFGLFLFFWLLAVLSEWLVPTTSEREAIVIIRGSKLHLQVRVAAAVVIQRWWRMEHIPSRQAMQVGD